MVDQATMDETEDAHFARKAKAKSKRGGRKKGARNKKTLQKLAELERELAGYKSTRRTKIAIDHMDEMIEWLRNLVGAAQAFDAAGVPRPGYDPKLWFRILDAFGGFLAMRAPYQSPRLSAIAIMPQQSAATQKTTVNVTILNERGDKVYSDADTSMEDDTKLIEHVPSSSDEAA